MKKKILFTDFSLRIGGIGKALVNLVNTLDDQKYDITILLQKKEDGFEELVHDHVHILHYDLSKNSNRLLRKVINMGKYIKLIIKNYHQYDFAGCFGAGYFPSALLAKLSSRNNAAWMHTNIVDYGKELKGKYAKYKTPEKKAKAFIRGYLFRHFKHEIFVSYNSRDAYLTLYPADEKKTVVCHNIFDYHEVDEKKNLPIEEALDHTKFTFLNVGRHSEYDKKLTRILNSAERLVKEKYDFQILFIGDGEETENYQKMVKEKNLESYILFLGRKLSPFAYFKYADCFLLSSQFEGFPVTLLESMVVGLPIITTDVSDAKRDIDQKYGIVVENSEEGVYQGMKQFLIHPFVIPEPFDVEQYNQRSLKILEGMINNES